MGKIAHADPGVQLTQAEYYDPSTHTVDGVADLNIVRTATQVVAASNALASSIAQADQKAGAAATQVQINAAIAALPVNSSASKIGTVALSEGVFTIAAPLEVVASPLTIRGQGGGTNAVALGKATELVLANSADCDMIRNPNAVERVLYLADLCMAGNSANNAAGSGINLDYIDLGGHYGNGLINIIITDFRENGIEATEHAYLTAAGFVIAGNLNDGIHSTHIQGWHIGLPNWIDNNGGWGVYATSQGDCMWDLYLENNGRGGCYLTTHNSIMRIWAKSNNWQGIYLYQCHNNSLTLHAAKNCLSAGGAGYYAGEIVLNGSVENTITVTTTKEEQLVDNIHGLYFVGNSYSNVISGTVEGTGYGLYLDTSPNMTDTSLTLRVNATDGLSNANAANLEASGMFLRLQGVNYCTDEFATSTSVTIGIGAYGSAKTVRSASGSMRTPKIRTDMGGTFDSETVTVKYEVVYRDGTTSYVEKEYTATGNTWFADDDMWSLLDSAKDTIRGIRWIRLYAKTTHADSTAVTCAVRAIV